MATTLLLLHGLGATGAVWQPLRDVLPDGLADRVVAPDLGGHGAAAWSPRYAFGRYAAEVAARVDPDDDLVVLGHSMGGVVALALASGWFGVHPRCTIGLGIKVAWSGEDLERAAALAARPARVLPTRDEAASWWLRVAGLTGIVAPGDPMVDRAVRASDGGWEVAWDPRTAAVGAPPMRSLLDAATGEVVLARGSDDAMVSTDDLRGLVDAPVELAGPHNTHVAAPGAVADLLVERVG